MYLLLQTNTVAPADNDRTTLVMIMALSGNGRKLVIEIPRNTLAARY
jgi:hypothetical protein